MSRNASRAACLFAAALLFAAPPLPAGAQTKTWTEAISGVHLSYTYTTFDKELPVELAQALSSGEWADAACLHGAIRQSSREEFPQIAMVTLAREGQTYLLALEKDEDSDWALEDSAAHAVLPDRDFAFSFDDRAGFQIRYPCEDGGEEVFALGLRSVRGLQEDDFCRCLVLQGYERRFADGGTLTIGPDAKQMFFSVTQISPSGEMQKERIPCVYTEFLEYLNVEEFPRTPEAVRAFAASAPRFDADVAVAGSFVNLRTDRSSRAESMGNYLNGTLVHVLETYPGDPWPWCRVRMGNIEGYMSRPYVSEPDPESVALSLSGTLLPVAKTLDACTLYEKLGSASKPVAQLEAGTRLHVLGTAGSHGLWLHVCVPRGEIGWLMDIEGTYGYLRTSDVQVAPTLRRLGESRRSE